jgi:hypothetical protein
MDNSYPSYLSCMSHTSYLRGMKKAPGTAVPRAWFVRAAASATKQPILQACLSGG